MWGWSRGVDGGPHRGQSCSGKRQAVRTHPWSLAPAAHDVLAPPPCAPAVGCLPVAFAVASFRGRRMGRRALLPWRVRC